MTERRAGGGRGQLSLSVVEAGVGVVLVLAVSMGFVLGVPQPDTRDTQLDAYARDAATVLGNEPPRHRGVTRLSEVARSADAFERERAALDRRVDRLLPDSLMYQVETPHGTVGYDRPGSVAVGVATVTTANGPVTVRVWYA
ncbi:DUF7262 family protein [Halomarina oriensis]|uniref:Uncharacterized protein n=1 Tax=Halomarina oriensis TaxID=671145 RepID=A0A6B0GPV7_9EURY|nr:hypothetical protein [Halomarina oriensis]MWG36916.1 hypothetical protein [Halomarina oriensis]